MLRFLAGACLGLCSFATIAQQADPAQAQALYAAGKMLQALPLYEELAKNFPSEMLYQDHLSLCLNASAAVQADDPAERRKAAQKSQEAAKRAVALGDTSYVVVAIANRDLNVPDIPTPLSAAQTLMHEAEKSFANGEYTAALTKYAQAADADPKLYEAPLYAGDAALKQKDNVAAAKWYERAVAINPNRETGYRYWGDAILSAATIGDPNSVGYKARAKMLDPLAKVKYLDAIVAEPYKAISWEGIKKWAKLRNATLVVPKIDRPAGPIPDPKNPANVTINIDPSKYAGKPNVLGCWMSYSLVRTNYRQKLFKQDHPEASEYRHTLKEESAALSSVITTAKEMHIKQEDMDDSLRKLIEINDAGMLDCWILFNGADRDIAQDYAGYRDQHRELLRQYLDRFVVQTSTSAT